MTVRDLIEELKAYDEDLPVRTCYFDWTNHIWDSVNITLVEEVEGEEFDPDKDDMVPWHGIELS